MATKVASGRASENGVLNRIKGHLRDWKMPDLGIAWPYKVTIEPTTGWGVSVGDVGPDLASRMLACNAENQRSRRPHYIRRLSSDMKDGRWVLTPEAVIFNTKGDLVDGQNRLGCIVETGCKIRLMVWFGAGGKKEMTNLNTGAGRDAADAAKVLGIGGITRASVATVRSFLEGASAYRESLTNSYVLELMKEYQPMVEFVHGIDTGQMGRLFTSPVRGAIGRAFYRHQPEKVARFVRVLCDVEPASEAGDKAAVLLRILQVNSAGAGGHGAVRSDLYRKAQRAILAFLNGEKLTKLYASEDDLFPMPTEAQMKARAK